MKIVVKEDNSSIVPMYTLKKGEYAIIVDTDKGYTGIIVYCAYNTQKTVQYIGLTESGMHVWNDGCPLLVRKLKASELQFVD